MRHEHAATCTLVVMLKLNVMLAEVNLLSLWLTLRIKRN